MVIWKEAEGTEMICHIMSMGPDSTALFHWHQNIEFCQPLNKGCHFLVNGTLLKAEPGDIITIDRQVVHRFLPQEPDVHIRVLQFPLRILLHSGVTAGSLRNHISKEDILSIPNLWQNIYSLMQLMEQEPRVCTGETNNLLQSLMSSLYFLLLKHFPAQESIKAQKDADLFFHAVAYVNAHFDREDNSMDAIAKQLCVSREKLSSVFLQYAGISLKQYINTLRINYVNQLLLEGWDISSASFKSGFGSIRTFNSVYKAVTGMTPTAFLQTHK